MPLCPFRIFLVQIETQQTKNQNAEIKDFKNLDKVCLKGDFDKLLSKTSKVISGNFRSSEAYYFKALANYEKYQLQNRESYFNKTISSLKKANKYDKTKNVAKLLDEQLAENSNRIRIQSSFINRIG